MYKFYNKHFDVLVCTTIIETGLDIPNVNTIVINSADKMGLSQLYQLRGRVGRTNKIAYAYLLYERDRILPEVAEKRLMAIKEFTSLGSGFKIAMRDLEIRGAGNLLGAEQSGHIAAVGFSLYTKLLEATIEELKGKEKEQIKEVEIDLNIDAYIPDDYISDSSQKIEVYKRIKDIKNEEDTTDIIDELIDRFGDLPDAVLKLVEIARIRIICKQLKIIKVVQQEKLINCIFKDGDELAGQKIIDFVEKHRHQVRIRASKQPEIGIKYKKGDKLTVLVRKVLSSLKQIVTNK